MNHTRARALLPAYADRQTGRLRRFLLQRHYDRCPACLAELEALQTVRSAVRTNLTVHRAPPGLASRIASALPREAPPVPLKRAFGFGMPVLGSASAGALGGACAGVLLTLWLGGGLDALPSGVFGGASVAGDPLIADAVSDHIRSMMGDHLTDVLSSNQHTVKPYLSARLELSPVVKDLTAEGYPLVGGRLDYLGGHRAAALVYRRASHVINLFAFADKGPTDAPPVLESRNGFHVAQWRTGGLTYLAVSDVEAAQLLTFAHLVATD